MVKTNNQILKDIITDLLIAHKSKVISIVDMHLKGKFFYSFFKPGAISTLETKITNYEQHEGDLSQIYYSLRVLESLHGYVIDDIVDSAVEGAQCEEWAERGAVPFWFKALIVLRLAKELGLIPVK